MCSQEAAFEGVMGKNMAMQVAYLSARFNKLDGIIKKALTFLYFL